MDRLDQSVKAFFLKYQAANSGAEFTGIGELYAETFMFGGPKGVQSVKKEDFLKVVPRMKSHFSSLGLLGTELHAVEAHAMDPKYLLAKVHWKMKLRMPSGIRDLDAFATYILQCNGDQLSIVFQIDHQDLASVVGELRSSEQ